MNVFLSWSGNRSHAVAVLLKGWLPRVIQALRPWLSSQDIDRGAVWFATLQDQLKETSIGIVCLTQENKHRPWILFEAGALAKGLTSSRVCTFLIDLTPTDLEPPLSQFNHTSPKKENMWELMRTLNKSINQPLEERHLEMSFEMFWPQFERDFEAALKKLVPVIKVEKRPPDEILAEILENTRHVNQRLEELKKAENRPPVSSPPPAPAPFNPPPAVSLTPPRPPAPFTPPPLSVLGNPFNPSWTGVTNITSRDEEPAGPGNPFNPSRDRGTNIKSRNEEPARSTVATATTAGSPCGSPAAAAKRTPADARSGDYAFAAYGRR